MAASRTFYAVIAAGVVFIAIGLASAVYANVAIKVPADGSVKPKGVDLMTPDMDTGNTAHIHFDGLNYTVIVKNPDNAVIASHNGTSQYTYDLTADKTGQYSIETRNLGNSSVNITGYAETKSSPLGFSGALMLAITGIVLTGLALRVRSSK